MSLREPGVPHSRVLRSVADLNLNIRPRTTTRQREFLCCLFNRCHRITPPPPDYIAIKSLHHASNMSRDLPRETEEFDGVTKPGPRRRRMDGKPASPGPGRCARISSR